MLKESKTQLPIKVIQFGEGNFLRAFVDWMIQEMNTQGIFNGQVAVVQPLSDGLIQLLNEQGCQYTHFMKGMKNGEPYVEHYINDSIGMTVNPYADFEAFLKLASIETASIIVSNTTEAGITFNPEDTMDQKADVTFPAKLTHLMYERFKLQGGDPTSGFILLPCELIDGNADKLRDAVLAYIELWALPEGFREWVLEHNTFCNTLVDRIVPGYPRDRIEQVWSELGYEDRLVVESELFNLWVVEGNDAVKAAFPAMDAGCNLMVVEDVTPFKMRKVRILNGAHTSLVPVAYLYGKETVRDAVEDPVLERYLNHILFSEIIPTLTLSTEALETFAGDVIERFKNPFIKHYLMSISLNSMSKYKTRVLPSLTNYLDTHDSLPKGLTLALAALIVFYKGEYKGKTIALKDNPDILDLYKSAWANYDGTGDSLVNTVQVVLAYEQNWGGNLNHLPGLTDAVATYARVILSDGIEEVLREWNGVIG